MTRPRTKVRRKAELNAKARGVSSEQIRKSRKAVGILGPAKQTPKGVNNSEIQRYDRLSQERELGFFRRKKKKDDEEKK